MDEYSVRIAQAADVRCLAKLHAKSFPSGWDEEAFLQLLGAGATILVTEKQNTCAGFIAFRFAAGEGEILTFCVNAGLRRQGIGARLLETFIANAQGAGMESLFLEVEENNQAAISLYKKAGFVIKGRRKAYYRQGNADALVMKKDLGAFP